MFLYNKILLQRLFFIGRWIAYSKALLAGGDSPFSSLAAVKICLFVGHPGLIAVEYAA
jgi:hypothetical protein